MVTEEISGGNASSNHVSCAKNCTESQRGSGAITVMEIPSSGLSIPQLAIRYLSAVVGDGVVGERSKQCPSFEWKPEPVLRQHFSSLSTLHNGLQFFLKRHFLKVEALKTLNSNLINCIGFICDAVDFCFHCDDSYNYIVYEEIGIGKTFLTCL